MKTRQIGEAPLFQADVRCDECGRTGSFSIDDVHLCLDCYANKGSCCAEAGGDDSSRGRPARGPEAS